jgi:RNA recognition motif-containing protein
LKKTNSFFINRYQLLKLIQKYGTIEKFDLLFHRSGPQAGQPRGYAFVTYKTIQDANMAKDALHNLRVGAKNIIVRWAHNVTEVHVSCIYYVYDA